MMDWKRKRRDTFLALKDEELVREFLCETNGCCDQQTKLRESFSDYENISQKVE